MRFKLQLIFSKYWFIIGITLKFIFLITFYFCSLKTDTFLMKGLAIKGGDYAEQFGTVDNFISYGTLSLDKPPLLAPYADRTPGYIFPYIIFRYFFAAPIAWQVHIFFQIVLNVCAAFLLFKLLSKTGLSFLLSLILFNIYIFSSYFSWFTFELAPDGMSIDAFVIAIYFFIIFFTTFNVWQLLVSGIFIAWCFHLRGFTLIYLPVFIVFICYFTYIQTKSILKIIKLLFVFFLPLFLITTCWTVRNYIQFKEIIPLQRAYVPNQKFTSKLNYSNMGKFSIFKIRKLVSTWGGDCLWYWPNTEMNWFLYANDDTVIPKYIPNSVFHKEFSKLHLVDLKKDLVKSINGSFTTLQHDSLEKLIITKAELYKKSILKNNPSLLFISPLKRMWHMFNKNPTADWVIKKNSLMYFFKFFSFLCYYIFLFLTLLSLIFIKKFKTIHYFSLSIITLSLLEFGFLIELFHFRYFSTAYVCVLILGFFTISNIFNKHKNKISF